MLYFIYLCYYLFIYYLFINLLFIYLFIYVFHATYAMDRGGSDIELKAAWTSSWPLISI